MLEAHDDVIGVAHNDDLASGLALSPSVCPEVKDVMEIDIGQQWRGNRPLGRACLRWHKISFFHHACLQPLADKAVYTTITDAVFDKAHQPLVTDRIEESRDIGVHYPVHLRAGNPDGQGVRRVMLAASRSEPVREPEYTFKPLGHAFPARCSARVLLSRVSLGPFPLLRQLRPATPEVHLCDIQFVRRPLRYYGRV